MMSGRLFAFSVIAASIVTGCASTSASQSFESGKVNVAVALYPIEEIVRAVGGNEVSVIGLVPPGESAHDYEPTPQQITALQSAHIVYYLGSGFQPNIEKAIASLPASVRKVDLLEHISLISVGDQLAGTDGRTDGAVVGNGMDPHVWLAPLNMQLLTEQVLLSLTEMPGIDADVVAAGAARYSARLGELHARFVSGLARCSSNAIVTSHRAFGYLAQAYGLLQIPISGISPAAEPSAKTLEAVARAAKQRNVSTIFFENNLPADLSTTIAREIGASTAVLDPVESLSKDQINAGANYVSVMEENLASLEKGLGCA